MSHSGGQSPLVLSAVVACEIAFWVVLAAGLAARYLLRLPRLSTVLLICVPLVDVALLTVAIIDLRTGGTAGLTHSLAGAYLGISVSFGPELVRRADARFAHRFAGGPKPAPPPAYGRPKVRYEWRMWARCVSALAISTVLTAMMYLLAGPRANALDLWNFEIELAAVTVIWLVAWPLRVTVFPPREPP
jgi:hypothetical protein